MKIKINQNLIRYLKLSTFDQVITKAQKILGAERVHLVDGVEILTNPTAEFGRLLAFLEVENDLDFEFNHEKGRVC